MNHDELRAVLTQALTEREAECAQVRAAIAALDGTNPPPAAITTSTVTSFVEGPPSVPRPKQTKRVAAGSFRCTECGQTFNRPNGLSRHMGQTHGTPNGRRRPLEVVTRTPDPRPTDTGPLVLRCGQCGDEFALGADPVEAMQAMRTHCRVEHDRSPNEIDRRPRPAAAPAVEVQS